MSLNLILEPVYVWSKLEPATYVIQSYKTQNKSQDMFSSK